MVDKLVLIGTVMEKQKVGAFLGTVSEEQIWSGPFILPSDGEITTDYGLQRYYNGVFANQYVLIHLLHARVQYGLLLLSYCKLLHQCGDPCNDFRGCRLCFLNLLTDTLR